MNLFYHLNLFVLDIILDGFTYDVSFTCPKCGSHSCIKITYDGSPRGDYFNFWAGSFMCYYCGSSYFNGKEFYYAHDCFSKVRVSSALQLTFDF